MLSGAGVSVVFQDESFVMPDTQGIGDTLRHL